MQCPFCPRTFATLDWFQLHVLKKHDGAGLSPPAAEAPPPISVLDFGSENWDRVPLEVLERCIHSLPHTGCITLAEYVWFNPEIPEQRNVFATSNHTYYILQRGRWVMRPERYVVRRMMSRVFARLFDTLVERTAYFECHPTYTVIRDEYMDYQNHTFSNKHFITNVLVHLDMMARQQSKSARVPEFLQRLL